MQLKPGAIYRKTISLTLSILGISFVLITACGILLAVFLGGAALAGRKDLSFLLFLVWIPCAVIVGKLIWGHLGFRYAAGYAAVVKNMIITGGEPKDFNDAALRAVKNRFPTAAAYRKYEKPLMKAFHQLMNCIRFKRKKADGTSISEYTETRDKIAVWWLYSYMKYAVLGYTFYRYDQNAAQSAADGIAIYYLNHKKLNGHANRYLLLNLITLAAMTAVFSIPVVLLFRIFRWNIVLAILLAFGIAWAIKRGFLDSYLTVKLMNDYMDAVDSTPIPDDLPAWLCRKSPAYRSILRRSRKLTAEGNLIDEVYSSSDIPVAEPLTSSAFRGEPDMTAITSDFTPVSTAQLTRVENGGAHPYEQYSLASEHVRPCYCLNCGAKNRPDATICTNCGNHLR